MFLPDELITTSIHEKRIKTLNKSFFGPQYPGTPVFGISGYPDTPDIPGPGTQVLGTRVPESEDTVGT